MFDNTRGVSYDDYLNSITVLFASRWRDDNALSQSCDSPLPQYHHWQARIHICVNPTNVQRADIRDPLQWMSHEGYDYRKLETLMAFRRNLLWGWVSDVCVCERTCLLFINHVYRSSGSHFTGTEERSTLTTDDLMKVTHTKKVTYWLDKSHLETLLRDIFWNSNDGDIWEISQSWNISWNIWDADETLMTLKQMFPFALHLISLIAERNKGEIKDLSLWV